MYYNDDFKAIQDAYNLMWTKEELNDLIEQFAEWLANYYDDPTPPSMRGIRFYQGETDDNPHSDDPSFNDNAFNQQYNFIANKNPDSAEGIMDIWEYFLKWQARERNEPNLINYIDKVQPYEFDPTLGQWMVEPKLD